MVNELSAKHRAAVLRPILELEKKGEPISAAIGDAAWELGLAKSHTWSLYRRLRENDARAAALELGPRGPKPGSKRIAQGVEDLIDESLRRYYLVRERSSFLRIWREIRAECEAKGFQPPTRKTVKARLDAMDQRKVLRKRHGTEEADKVFAARPGRLEVSAPLEVVQIDHTTSDITLVDHVNRRPLARPYLTVAIDVATRIVLGVYVTFDEPSVLSIALCLDHCVRRKSVHLPETLEEVVWPTAGIPKAIHVDNAQEFHSEQDSFEGVGAFCHFRSSRSVSRVCLTSPTEASPRAAGRPQSGAEDKFPIKPRLAGWGYLALDATMASATLRGASA